MAISVGGIIINIIMIIGIIILIIVGVIYNNQLNSCQTKQSSFCYNISCPCDDKNQGPCFGYSKMPAGKEGQWYCSNAPLTIVDNNGNVVK